MRVLIVEGMPEKGINAICESGGTPYGLGYAAALKKLDPSLECEIAYPSENGVAALPEGRAFSDYAGAALTGSSLDVFIETPPVTNQLKFLEALFGAGVPVFGSCWGLQIMTALLGGRVDRAPKGREIGISRMITQTDEGHAHPMYAGKHAMFDAFTVHVDEVIEPAPGTVLLATNSHSRIQAMAGEQGGNWFWGVQYHPEYDGNDMACIYKRLARLLVKEGVCNSEKEALARGQALTKVPDLFDRIELQNWLAAIRPA